LNTKHQPALSACVVLVVVFGVVVGIVVVVMIVVMPALAALAAFIIVGVVFVIHLESTSLRMILYNASIF